ncbi:MAG: DoxX family membrane protein [bacterium]|nr:DoxX family membrane protein [bacterium]
MKITSTVLRVLMGLLFLFASLTYWFKLIVPPPLEGAMKVFNDGLEASRYLIPTVKALELLGGLALVLGRFVPLALLVLAPIVVNILLIHIFLAPEGLPIALFLVVASLLVAYQRRDSFRPLFKP